MIKGNWRKGIGPVYHHFFREGSSIESRSLCGLIVYARTKEPLNLVSEYAKCRTCEKMRQGIAVNKKGVRQ